MITVNGDLSNFQNTLNSAYNGLQNTINSANYNSLGTNVATINTAIQQLSQVVANNQGQVDGLRTLLARDRESMMTGLGNLISAVQTDVLTAQSNINSALSTYTTQANTALSTAATNAMNALSSADTNNQNSLTSFLSVLNTAFAVPEASLSALQSTLIGDTDTLSGVITYVNAQIANTTSAFSVLQAAAQTIANSMVSTYAPGDLASGVSSLVSTFNTTVIQPQLTNLASVYSQIMNDPATGLLAQIASNLNSEQNELVQVSSAFSVNQSGISATASSLTQLPTTLFAGIQGELSGKTTEMMTDASNFHVALSTALATAQNLYTATKNQGEASDLAASNEWAGIEAFLTQSSSGASANIIQQLASMEADAGLSMLGTASAGVSAANDIAAQSAATSATVGSTANAAIGMLQSSQSSAMEQMAQVNQLLSMNGGSLNSTLNLLGDFLKSRSSAVSGNFASAISDLAGSMGSISSQVGSMASASESQLASLSQSQQQQATAEVQALASAQNLSAAQTAALYAAIDSGNTEQFKTLASQIAAANGLAVSLSGSVADMAANLAGALGGASYVAKNVQADMNAATTAATTQIAALRGSLSAATQAAQRSITSAAANLATGLSSSESYAIATLKANTSNLVQALSLQQQQFDEQMPALSSAAQTAQSSLSVWLSKISAAESGASEDAAEVLDQYNFEASDVGRSFQVAGKAAIKSAQETVLQDIASRASSLNESLVVPQSLLVQELGMQTGQNITNMTATLQRVQGILNALETGSSMINEQTMSAFDNLVAQYRTANITHQGLIAAANNQLSSGISTEQSNIDTFTHSITGMVEDLNSEANGRLSLVSDQLAIVAGQGADILASLIKSVSDFEDQTAANQLRNHQVEMSDIASAETALTTAQTAVNKKITLAQSAFNVSNEQLVNIISQLASALNSANIEGFDAVGSVNGLASDLGYSTAQAANNLAALISNNQGSASSYGNNLQGASTETLSAGSDALGNAVFSLSSAAEGISGSANSQTSSIVDQMKQTSQQYLEVNDAAGAVAETSAAAIARLIAVFNYQQNAVSDLMKNTTFAHMSQVEQVAEIMAKWQTLANMALNETSTGVTEIGSLINLVSSDVTNAVNNLTTQVNKLADSAVEKSYIAASDADQAMNLKGPILKGLVDQIAALLTQQGASYVAVTGNKTLAENQLASMGSTAAQDSTIPNAFSTWLGSYKSAFNQDVLSISS